MLPLLLASSVVCVLGVCFVAEDPKERKHLRKISPEAAEAVTYKASAQWRISRRRGEPT
jgi:hypothetical protein